MADINVVSISGRLTRDSELRQTTSGNSVLSFCVASNDRRKNASGEWEDHPNFIDCSLFGNRGPVIQSRMTKGTKVCLQGKLRQRSWEKDGTKHSRIEIMVDEVEIMQRQNNTASGMQAAPQQAPQPTQQQTGFYDEDIPF